MREIDYQTNVFKIRKFEEGGLNPKFCALGEGRGRLMAAAIAPGQFYEVEAAAQLLKTSRRILLVGDKNFFQRIKIYKRVSTRYEKLALTFFNFVLLVAIFDWLKSF